MTDGCPEIDPHGSDIARFYEHQRTTAHIRARTAEGYNKTYGIVHPAEQWDSNRRRAGRAVLRPPAGARRRVHRGRRLGAAALVRLERRPLEEYGDRVMPREAEWESRWWSPIINAEHLAMRERVGIVDLSAFAIFDVSGPGALGFLQRMAVAQMDVPGRPGGLHVVPERGRRCRRPTSRSCGWPKTRSGS